MNTRHRTLAGLGGLGDYVVSTMRLKPINPVLGTSGGVGSWEIEKVRL